MVEAASRRLPAGSASKDRVSLLDKDSVLAPLVSMHIPAPRATRDHLPEEAAARRRVTDAFAGTAERYGFEPVETPAFEKIELFSARSGPEIKSSMLTFHCDHEEFALRPELTAPICRLAASGALDAAPSPHRLYYSGSCFRYCRPQSGRTREFTQAGLELVGEAGPRADAEVIAAACRFLRELGIEGFQLRIGTVGIYRDLLGDAIDPDDRNSVLGHLDRLAGLRERADALARGGDDFLADELRLERRELAEIQERFDYEGEHRIGEAPELSPADLAARLPLEAEAAFWQAWSVEGVVDEKTSELLLAVSRLRGPLGDVSAQARELLRDTAAVAALDELVAVCRQVEAYGLGTFETVLGIARGLTFYSGTVFEITSGPEAAAVKYCGGGRYDSLVELFGGEPTPSAGCAFRIDAVVKAFRASDAWSKPPAFQVFLLTDQSEAARVAAFVEQLRDRGVRAGFGLGVASEDSAAHNTEWIGSIDGETVRLTNGEQTVDKKLSADELAVLVAVS